MNQIWKNDKEPNVGPDFDPFGPNLGPQFFLQVLPLLVIRHFSKLSSYATYRKTNEPNLANDKKPNFGPDFGLFDSNLGPKFFLEKGLRLLVVVKHCSKLSSFAI